MKDIFRYFFMLFCISKWLLLLFTVGSSFQSDTNTYDLYINTVLSINHNYLLNKVKSYETTSFCLDTTLQNIVLLQESNNNIINYNIETKSSNEIASGNGNSPLLIYFLINMIF